MRTIEITTTQNVTIEYELAAVRDRIIAFIIDFLIIWASIGVLLILIEVAAPSFSSIFTYLVIVPIFFFYTLASEIFFNGQSWGKKALRLKVVKISGTEAGISDYLIRWTFRMIDIYFSLGSMASLLVSSTDKAQRLGDILANTAVIKVKPSAKLRLNDIMKINSLQNYVPTYTAVSRMREDEMLVVKNVLDRVKKYPNASQHEIMDELVKILCNRLNIEPLADQQHFLRTLINDYIVLTR